MILWYALPMNSVQDVISNVLIGSKLAIKWLDSWAGGDTDSRALTDQ